MANQPRKYVYFKQFVTVIITAGIFPREKQPKPDKLQITPTLCRTLLSDLYLLQAAFHELVLVLSSGRLSPYTVIFLLYFILYILHVSGIRSLWRRISFLRTSQTSNESSYTKHYVSLASYPTLQKTHCILWSMFIWCAPHWDTPNKYGNPY
jgi:Ca2+/Na+ antiporter